MTALAANREAPDLNSFEATKYAEDFVVIDADIIYHGAMVAINTSTEEVQPAADAASIRILGVNVGPKVDNTADGESLKGVNLSRGIHLMNNGDAIDSGNIGAICYASDDNTVDLGDPGSAVIAGVIHSVVSDGVYVDFSSHSI